MTECAVDVFVGFRRVLKLTHVGCVVIGRAASCAVSQLVVDKRSDICGSGAWLGGVMEPCDDASQPPCVREIIKKAARGAGYWTGRKFSLGVF